MGWKTTHTFVKDSKLFTLYQMKPEPPKIGLRSRVKKESIQVQHVGQRKC